MARFTNGYACTEEHQIYTNKLYLCSVYIALIVYMGIDTHGLRLTYAEYWKMRVAMECTENLHQPRHDNSKIK